MSWCRQRQCPYLSRHGCRMAAELAGLPVDTCPVTDEECGECMVSSEPTHAHPNHTVATLARRAIYANQPERLAAFNSRHPLPDQTPQIQESDAPCIHRGEKRREVVCTPCKGSRTHSVHWCKLKGRECTPLVSEAKDENDGEPVEYCLTCPSRQVRARAPHERRINYIQTPDGKDCGAAWSNRFKGGSVFLVCGGPSLNEMDLSPLNQRGVMVAAVNNVAASHVRPQLWFSVDQPIKFHQSIFADPGIACFLKDGRCRLHTRRIKGDESISGPKAGDYPNVFRFNCDSRRTVRPHDFLASDMPQWPMGEPRRCVMVPTLRVLIDMGFSTIYLLGCDFKMHKGKNGDSPDHPGSYAFDEGKNDRACRSNNGLFASVDAFFSNLNPILKGHGISVYNCTPGGYMTAFERMPFAEAIDRTLATFPKVDSLFGYYWRAA